MRKVAGRLRLDLAQYRELEAFAAFASDLDRASRDQLERGAPPGRAAQAAATTRRTRSRSRSSRSGPAPRASSTTSRSATSAGSRREFLQYLRHAHAGMLATIADGDVERRHRRPRWTRRSPHFKQMFLAADGRPCRQRGRRPRRWPRAWRRRRRSSASRRPRRRRRSKPWPARYAFCAGGSGRPARRRRSPRRWSSSRRAASPRRRRGWRRRCRTRGDHVVLTALASNASIDHPLLQPRPTGAAGRRAGHHQRPRSVRRLQRQRDPDRRAADRAAARRGQAGRCCTSSAARASATTGSVTGRSRRSWTGFSEQPTFADAREIGDDADRGVRGRRGRRGRPTSTRRRGRRARRGRAAHRATRSSGR